MQIKENNLKISLSIFFAIIISVALFFLIMYNLPDNVFQNYKNFFSQDLGEKNKIFIIGSSHISPINPMIIAERLGEKEKFFEVYNLGVPSDDFEDRERTIEMMLSHDPKVVVIGLEPRYFESLGRSITQIPDDSLPRIPSFNEILDSIEFGEKKGIMKNPKFALIRTMTNPIDSEIESFSQKYSPFFKQKDWKTEILKDKELKKLNPEYTPKINPIEKNSNLYALNNIIQKLSEEKVKIVIFVTPHSKYFIDRYPESHKIEFQSIINEISEKNYVYSLYDKYAYDEVWNNHTHLAVNKNTEFYSEDVAEFIVKELEK